MDTCDRDDTFRCLNFDQAFSSAQQETCFFNRPSSKLRKMTHTISICRLTVAIASVASAVSVFAADAHKEGYKDTPLIPGTEWHVHDSDRPVPRVITPGAKFSQMADAPSDAVI